MIADDLRHAVRAAFSALEFQAGFEIAVAASTCLVCQEKKALPHRLGFRRRLEEDRLFGRGEFHYPCAAIEREGRESHHDHAMICDRCQQTLPILPARLTLCRPPGAEWKIQIYNDPARKHLALVVW